MNIQEKGSGFWSCSYTDVIQDSVVVCSIVLVIKMNFLVTIDGTTWDRRDLTVTTGLYEVQTSTPSITSVILEDVLDIQRKALAGVTEGIR